MAVGTVSTSILTDIANAIRYQAGVATTYKPREMAEAVAALDGTDAGQYQEQPYMALESGVLPESVFSDIASAIRGQNGESTLYTPGDMAAAILALEWDVGYKIRALLLDDGTLEINYYERRTSVTGGRIVQVFEIDPAGYSSASARSYDSIKLLVKKVYIDSTIAGLGIKNCNYWFNAFSNCTEVRGFENLSGMTSANQMFTSCTSLETIYATSFSNSGLSGSLMFNSCNRLVGGTDGFVPSQTSGASVCKLGAGGVLTDPNDDRRTWFWAHFYADGEGVLTATSTPDATRELVASGRICAIGKYVGLGFTPWDGVTGPTHRQHLTSATFAADMATFSYLNFNYLFYSCTNLASVNGLGNLSGVRSMRYTFSSCAFTTIDLRGFDPSTLMDLFYTFSGCSHMTTIYADATGHCLRAGSRARNASTRARLHWWAETGPHGRAARRRTRTSASTRRARRGTSQRASGCGKHQDTAFCHFIEERVDVLVDALQLSVDGVEDKPVSKSRLRYKTPLELLVRVLRKSNPLRIVDGHGVLREDHLACINGGGGRVGGEQHRPELRHPLVIRTDGDCVLDGNSLFDPLNGIAQPHDDLYEHRAHRHRAEVDEVVSLVVHALNNLGDRLLILADAAELQEVEQPHHGRGQPHGGRHV